MSDAVQNERSKSREKNVPQPERESGKCAGQTREINPLYIVAASTAYNLQDWFIFRMNHSQPRESDGTAILLKHALRLHHLK